MKRFNLLLLEEGESLLEEAAGALVSSIDSTTARPGRWRLATRCVYFEPEDVRQPVLRLSLRAMPAAPALLSSCPAAAALVSKAGAEVLRDGIVFNASSVVEMKAGGLIGPYKTRSLEELQQGKTSSSRGGASPSLPTFVMLPSHLPADGFLPLLSQLHAIQATAAKSASWTERAAIDPLLASRRDGPFDLSLLADYREKTLLPASPTALNVERVFPLVSCPGRLMVTDAAIYFQPVAVNSVAGSDPVTRWALKDVSRVARRTRLQRGVGLELLFGVDTATAEAEAAAAAAVGNPPPVLPPSRPPPGGAAAAAAGLSPAASSSVFLSFDSQRDRDAVHRKVLTLLRERLHRGPVGASADSPYDDLCGDISPSRVGAVTRLWQSRRLSNFDYLSFLNLAAGRTFADLSQYPVFPWVLSDYASSELDLEDPTSFRDLSKPIGALNAARLEHARVRYTEMPRGPGLDPPFMYGTHYSSPGYCLHYLVRAMPEHQLKLQGGRFDAPDRLFFDMRASWEGIVSPNMDVKEAVPEFYAGGEGSWLMLPEGLDLGVRQNGRRVADVGLPPWAEGDPSVFLSKLSEALECEHTSAHLHAWIDLIFGAKQRGPAAAAADNVFHHLTYDDALAPGELEGMSPQERAAVQQQIAEFGQTPRQLFTAPHPCRNDPVAEEAVVPAPAPAKATPAPVLASPVRAPGSRRGSLKATPGPTPGRSAGGSLSEGAGGTAAPALTASSAWSLVCSSSPLVEGGAAGVAALASCSCSTGISLVAAFQSGYAAQLNVVGAALETTASFPRGASTAPAVPLGFPALAASALLHAAVTETESGAPAPPMPLTAAALDPSGTLLLAASTDGAVRLYCASSKQEVGALGPAADAPLTALAVLQVKLPQTAVSSGAVNLLVLTGDASGTLAVWAVRASGTGEALVVEAAPRPAWTTTLTPLNAGASGKRRVTVIAARPEPGWKGSRLLALTDDAGSVSFWSLYVYPSEVAGGEASVLSCRVDGDLLASVDTARGPNPRYGVLPAWNGGAVSAGVTGAAWAPPEALPSSLRRGGCHALLLTACADGRLLLLGFSDARVAALGAGEGSNNWLASASSLPSAPGIGAGTSQGSAALVGGLATGSVVQSLALLPLLAQAAGAHQLVAVTAGGSSSGGGAVHLWDVTALLHAESGGQHAGEGLAHGGDYLLTTLAPAAAAAGKAPWLGAAAAGVSEGGVWVAGGSRGGEVHVWRCEGPEEGGVEAE